MFRIDDPTAAAALPAPEAAGTPGYFTEGSPGAVSPTLVRASFLNMLQEEFIAVCVAAGIAPSKTTYDQLLTALRSAGVFTTPAQFDASTKVATTAFVQRALGNAAGLLSINGGVLGLDASYIGKVINNFGGAATVNLPSVAGIAPGSGYLLSNSSGGGAMTINANGADTIVGGTSGMVLGTGDTALVYAGASGVSWLVVGGSYNAAGRLVNVQIITATGTYTPTPGMKTAIVEAVGGGGGGGGTAATAAGQFSVGGGGASGSYGKGRFTAAQIGASQAITIGAAGAGATAGANNGGAGGTTSFGALLSAPGGGGGGGSISAAPPIISTPGFPGATATGGNIISTPGATGGIGIGAGVGGDFSGSGAGSPIAGGAGGAKPVPASSAGLVGSIYGAGGSGGCGNVSDTARAGGAGMAGAIIVYEYA